MRPTGPRLDKHGFPIPPDFNEAGVDDPGSRAGSWGPFLRRVLKVAVVVGLLSALWFHFNLGDALRDFIGRYHAQQAYNLALRGELDAALAKIDQALEWTPNSVAFLFIRASIRVRQQDYAGALPDLDQALTIKPNDERVQSLRMEILHRLHRHRDAAAAATDMLARQIGGRATVLNSRAYARALDDTSTAEELEVALADIDESLASSPQNASFLDTRGYVLFKLGRRQEALADVQQAITIVEKQRDDFERAGKNRKWAGDQAALRAEQQKLFDQDLAVMYHHRGEIREKLGDTDQGRKDKEIGKKLGFNPAAGVY